MRSQESMVTRHLTLCSTSFILESLMMSRGLAQTLSWTFFIFHWKNVLAKVPKTVFNSSYLGTIFPIFNSPFSALYCKVSRVLMRLGENFMRSIVAQLNLDSMRVFQARNLVFFSSFLAHTIESCHFKRRNYVSNLIFIGLNITESSIMTRKSIMTPKHLYSWTIGISRSFL